MVLSSETSYSVINCCLDEVSSAQLSCASDERVFAEGAGLVYYRKDVRSQDAVQTGREEFRVWEILDPF